MCCVPSLATEENIRRIGAMIEREMRRLIARSTLVDASLRILLKHKLLDELSHELSNPPIGSTLVTKRTRKPWLRKSPMRGRARMPTSPSATRQNRSIAKAIQGTAESLTTKHGG